MTKKRNIFTLILLLIFLTPLLIGCLGHPKPSDAEAIEAINKSEYMNQGAFIVKTPLTIMERKGPNPDGSWTFKVKFTIDTQRPDGRVLSREYISPFRLVRQKESKEKNAWQAILGF